MEEKLLFVISQSSADLQSVLKVYCDALKNGTPITILTFKAQNYQFLKTLFLQGVSIRYLPFDSLISSGVLGRLSVILELVRRRLQLNELATEICSHERNMLIFYSLNSDPFTSYLVHKVAQTNRVTFLDVLRLEVNPVRLKQLGSIQALKNILYLFFYSCIFGNIFFLAGNSSYQYLSLNLKCFKSLRFLKEAYVVSDIAIDEFLYQMESKCSVILLYNEPLGVDSEKSMRVYKDIVDILKSEHLTFFIKCHPQSSLPDFMNGLPQIPKFIPFELIEARCISLVIGVFSAAMAQPKSFKVVSFARLVYSNDSDFYLAGIRQLRANPQVKLISSLSELAAIINNQET
jgi:hypothetical protein